MFEEKIEQGKKIVKKQKRWSRFLSGILKVLLKIVI